MRDLTVLLPVTREWTLDAVCASVDASDIPRGRCIIVRDAPVSAAWVHAMFDMGFDVEMVSTGNPHPPAGRVERRDRHRAMRRLTQTLVPDGPLLCLEDDTIVPPDVYARLSSAGPNATGVQVGRHESRQVGVWGYSDGRGIEPITACGHYCLLTTGAAYKAAHILDAGAVDRGHTQQIRPLVVDWDCRCGHLTDGGVLWP